MNTITMGQPARRDTPTASLDGTARRVLQCLLAADVTGGEGTVVAVGMRRLRRRLGVRPSDVMLAVRALTDAGLVTDITGATADRAARQARARLAAGEDDGPVRVFRLETRQSRGGAR